MDDDATNREIMETVLTMNNWQVTLVANGQRALEVLHKTHADLLITDIRMPDMNGYELCSAVRADQRTTLLPILIISGFSEPRDVRIGKDAGANDFLTRPFDLDELVRRVAALLKPAKTIP